MAIHSNILAWKIPWTEEPGGLSSKGLQTVRHNCATKHTHTRGKQYKLGLSNRWTAEELESWVPS